MGLFGFGKKKESGFSKTSVSVGVSNTGVIKPTKKERKQLGIGSSRIKSLSSVKGPKSRSKSDLDILREEFDELKDFDSRANIGKKTALDNPFFDEVRF